MSYTFTKEDLIENQRRNTPDIMPEPESKAGSSAIQSLLSGPRSSMAMIPGQAAGFLGLMFPQYQEQAMKVAQSYGNEIAGKRTSAPEFGEALTQGAATIGSPFLAPIIAEQLKKGIDYMRPGKDVEKFRSTLGEGTSRENIETLGKRIELAAKSSKEEALIPKTEFEAAANDKRIIPGIEVEKPNLLKVSRVFNKASHDFSNAQQNALEKVLKKYYKTGDLDALVSKGEKIFDLDEGLTEKQVSKLEAVLPFENKKIPTGSYLKPSDVDDPYRNSGELEKLHNKYAANPTYQNADALKSRLSKEVREYETKRTSPNGLSDLEKPRYEKMKRNYENLENDMNKFAETLPPEQRNKYNEFRQKYREYATTYKSGKEAPTIAAMAKGKSGEVTPDMIGPEFTQYTERVKKVLKDIGPEGAKNILYNALRNVPEGDAHKMAQTILDLHKTKGYDLMVTPEMLKWAKDMRRRYWMSKAISTGGGALLGEEFGGHVGGALGAALPWIKDIGSKGAELLKYIRK